MHCSDLSTHKLRLETAWAVNDLIRDAIQSLSVAGGWRIVEEACPVLLPNVSIVKQPTGIALMKVQCAI